MIDLTDWDWGGEYPINKWIKVLVHTSKDDKEDLYVEGIARLTDSGTGRYWTTAPGQDIWGPIVGWRELEEGEQP